MATISTVNDVSVVDLQRIINQTQEEEEEEEEEEGVVVVVSTTTTAFPTDENDDDNDHTNDNNTINKNNEVVVRPRSRGTRPRRTVESVVHTPFSSNSMSMDGMPKQLRSSIMIVPPKEKRSTIIHSSSYLFFQCDPPTNSINIYTVTYYVYYYYYVYDSLWLIFCSSATWEMTKEIDT